MTQIRRVGRLSKGDMDFIRDNVSKMPAQEIAVRLLRNLETIEKYIAANFAPDDVFFGKVDEKERSVIRAELKSTYAWKQLLKELEPDEVRLFEEKYVELMQQFREDVSVTEHNQIFKAVKYEILMGRNLAQQKRMERKIRDLETRQDEAISRDEIEDAERIESSLNSANIAKKSKIAEYSQLEERHQSLMEALKGTRKQREERAERSKTSFVELVRSLMSEDVRDREGRMAERARRAAAKEMERLGAAHTYMDGVQDRPILSADTVAQPLEEDDATHPGLPTPKKGQKSEPSRP